MKGVFQVLSIVDSLLLIGLVSVIWVFPHSAVPLLSAGMLAGLNAVFQSAVLDPIPYQVRVTLRVGGFVVALVMAISMAFVK